jgi:predicted amidohydrolase
VVQFRSTVGAVVENISRHLKFIDLAVRHGAQLILFPELSLTAYEPKLANELAVSKDDQTLLERFQLASDSHGVIIGVGMPTFAYGVDIHQGVNISMPIFRPNLPRLVYSKKYLHSDEDPYFIGGSSFPSLTIHDHCIGFAICYELSVPEHSAKANDHGAKFYLASVAKSASGVEKANACLSAVASKYSMVVMMANGLGFSDNFTSAGNSAIWNSEGEMLTQMDMEQEGILMYDSETKEVSIIEANAVDRSCDE